MYKNLSLKTREIKDVSMNFKPQKLTRGFSSGSVVKESACNVEVAGSILGLGRSPGGGHDNPLFLPGESCGQRRLAGYSPGGHKESDMTEATEHARKANTKLCVLPRMEWAS